MKNLVLSLIISSLMLLYLLFGARIVEKGSREEAYEILKDAINRAALQCYAIEGFFPPNIEYLEENYGLIVDYDKYFVTYEAFASNIMPIVDVFIK